MKTLNKLLRDAIEDFILRGFKEENLEHLRKLEIEIKDFIIKKFNGYTYHKKQITKIVREM